MLYIPGAWVQKFGCSTEIIDMRVLYLEIGKLVSHLC